MSNQSEFEINYFNLNFALMCEVLGWKSSHLCHTNTNRGSFLAKYTYIANYINDQWFEYCQIIKL